MWRRAGSQLDSIKGITRFFLCSNAQWTSHWTHSDWIELGVRTTSNQSQRFRASRMDRSQSAEVAMASLEYQASTPLSLRNGISSRSMKSRSFEEWLMKTKAITPPPAHRW